MASILERLRERRAREWWELSPLGLYLQYRVLANIMRAVGISHPFRTWIGRLLYQPRQHTPGDPCGDRG